MKSFKQILKENPQFRKDINTRKPADLVSLDIELELIPNYNLITNITSKYFLYKEKNEGGFILGFFNNSDFNIFLSIAAHNLSYENKTIKFLDNPIQITMIEINKSFDEQGYTKRLYLEIAKRFDLVSGSTQFGNSVQLWKSLAKSNSINIYVYNKISKNYLVDENKIINYNGANINEKLIWGSTDNYQDILLVATTKEILHN